MLDFAQNQHKFNLILSRYTMVAKETTFYNSFYNCIFVFITDDSLLQWKSLHHRCFSEILSNSQNICSSKQTNHSNHTNLWMVASVCSIFISPLKQLFQKLNNFALQQFAYTVVLEWTKFLLSSRYLTCCMSNCLF